MRFFRVFRCCYCFFLLFFRVPQNIRLESSRGIIVYIYIFFFAPQNHLSVSIIPLDHLSSVAVQRVCRCITRHSHFFKCRCECVRCQTYNTVAQRRRHRRRQRRNNNNDNDNITDRCGTADCEKKGSTSPALYTHVPYNSRVLEPSIIGHGEKPIRRPRGAPTHRYDVSGE